MKIVRDKSGRLTYRYRCSPDCGFAFSMLCEVGQPYQPAARALLAAKYPAPLWRIDYGRDLDARPWCADFATKL